MSRRAGFYQLQVDGVLYEAKGTCTYNFGVPLREAIVGAAAIPGYKETPQVSFVELAVTDSASLDVKALLKITNATVTVSLANQKTLALRNAWFAGEGSVTTDEAEIAVRFESSIEAEEI